MASTGFITESGLMGDLSETETIYTIANGEKVASQQILRDAEITIGDCSYTIDLVVTDNPLFDLLVGNNFLVQGEAEISLGSQTMTLTTEHFGQRTTQVLGLETPGTTGADLVLAIDEQSKGEPSVDGEQGTVPERPQQPPPIN